MSHYRLRSRLRWYDLVDTVQDLRGYKAVVHSMFEDGHTNTGRLAVLKVFTDDVCRGVDRPELIREYYTKSLLPKLSPRSKPPPPRPSAVVSVAVVGVWLVALGFYLYG